MAAEMVTPEDHLTGLPLPIAPRCKWLPKNNPNIADIHHAEHPQRSPHLKTLAGLALRNCRLQLIERQLHNEGPLRYHKTFAGPRIPLSEQEVFSRVVVACAGSIPEEVIDLETGEPFVRRATQKEIDFLRTPDKKDPFGYRYIFYRYEPVRDFLQDYVTRQDLKHISNNRIDEFLHTKDEGDKLRIGRFLLRNAVAVASDPLVKQYAIMRRQERLHPAMPPDPQHLVHYKLGTTQLRDTLIPNLESNLLRTAA